MQARPDLIVFSHLRWNFVWQRPQHLMTRLAAERRVLFIEEPERAEGEPSWDYRNAAPGVVVCTPRTPCDAPGFHDDQEPHLASLMARLLDEQSVGAHDAWFYTPMALPLLSTLRPRAVVYDCMDELSAFRGAPTKMLDREAELLLRADVVFTGGPSLYEAKKGRHPGVHCFPSSVDLTHFRKALDAPADHPAQADLPRPRLGFYGVIDERIDLDLLDAAAGRRPDWQFVMVGPVVKIDPASLPRRPNLHYLGQRPYEDLPTFLSGWDVCLLPFARNEATRFISPTKTLEYMAAETPIVSTPIRDVADPYGTLVELADTADAFVDACDRAMAYSAGDWAGRLEGMRAILARTSWDETAAQMGRLIREAGSTPNATTSATRSGRDVGTTPPVIVAGAGPTGLSAAYHLGEDALLLEQNDRVGGWCRSIEENGFTFDFAGHIMFSNDPYVHEMYELLLGDNVHWQDREAWIYSKDVYTRYPFQGALYGLPPDVIKECIVGAIEARFGSLKKAEPAPAAPANGHANGHAANGHNGNGHATNGHSGNGKASRPAHKAEGNSDSWCKPGSVEDCCADGVMESTAPLARAANGSDPSGAKAGPKNFEEFIYQVWGAGIAKHFAIPYNRKLWSVPLTEMETSWLGGRVPLPDLGEMIEGALKPVPKPMGPNARFGYPLRGGFQSLMDGFLPHLRGRLRMGTRVASVSPSRHQVTLDDGTELSYEQFISTMPLPVLIRLMGDEAPEEVRRAVSGLRHVSVRCVNIGVGREKLTEKHWIYYPEDTIFHRIFVQGNASPHCNPPGGFGLTCEITYHPQYKPLPCDGDELIRRCIDDCRKVGVFSADDPILAANQVDMPHAYVVYDHARPKNVALIRDWLRERDIILAGRYSEWEYYNSDHAFLAGKKAAETVRAMRDIDPAEATDPVAVTA